MCSDLILGTKSDDTAYVRIQNVGEIKTCFNVTETDFYSPEQYHSNDENNNCLCGVDLCAIVERDPDVTDYTDTGFGYEAYVVNLDRFRNKRCEQS